MRLYVIFYGSAAVFMLTSMAWPYIDREWLGGFGLTYAVLPGATFLILFFVADIYIHMRLERSIIESVASRHGSLDEEDRAFVRKTTWASSPSRIVWDLAMTKVGRRPQGGPLVIEHSAKDANRRD